MTGAGAASGTDHLGEIIRCVQATTSGKHGVRDCADQGRQADSSSRPLRRRAARMARPARVRIRSRKPWVFERRRLFGWKVRLLTGISPLRGLLKILERCSGESGDAWWPTEVSLRSNGRRGRGSMKRPVYAGSLQGTDSRADGSNSPGASPTRAAATRRTRSQRPARSCGKARKVVSVPGARLGFTESPGATLHRRERGGEGRCPPLVIHTCG
jgi:hypothetical protein